MIEEEDDIYFLKEFVVYENDNEREMAIAYLEYWAFFKLKKLKLDREEVEIEWIDKPGFEISECLRKNATMAMKIKIKKSLLCQD